MGSNLKPQKLGKNRTVWTTPGGSLTTQHNVKAEFTILELHDDKLIKWQLHVAKDLGEYDMIIGWDILEFLGVDIKFSNITIKWANASIPFRDTTSKYKDAYHIQDSKSVAESTKRIKEILKAKYEPANLKKICQEHKELNVKEKRKLFKLLTKYSTLFDGSLGTWKGSKVKLELKEGAQPYHSKAFPIPRIHMDTLK